MRGIDKKFNEGNRERAIALHGALKNASIPADCTVYRGTSEKALGMLRFLPDSMLTGRVISDAGFMSTSLDRSGSFGGNALLEIEAPKGSHGAYIGHISSAGPSEQEVLFDAGQKMRIIEAKRDANGRRIIKVRILT